VLGEDAFYFSDHHEIHHLLGRLAGIDPQRREMTENNRRRIATEYAWDKIVADYEQFFHKAEAT
jgi:spore maturation protein CgeB